MTGAVQPLGEPGPGEYAISLRSDDEPRTFSGRAIPWAVGSGANTAGLRSALVDIGGWDERLGTGPVLRTGIRAMPVGELPRDGGPDLVLFGRVLDLGDGLPALPCLTDGGDGRSSTQVLGVVDPRMVLRQHEFGCDVHPSMVDQSRRFVKRLRLLVDRSFRI